MSARWLLLSLTSLAAGVALAQRARRRRASATPATYDLPPGRDDGAADHRSSQAPAPAAPVAAAARGLGTRHPRWDWPSWAVLLGLVAVGTAWLLAGWSVLERNERGRLFDRPRLLSPSSGELITTTLPVLKWRSPAGALHYELVLTPMMRQGSVIHMYGALINEYQPPPPPAWCCIEPDTLYFWKVRVSFAEQPVTPEDADAWGPWAESWFYVARPADPDGTAAEISLPESRPAAPAGSPVGAR